MVAALNIVASLMLLVMEKNRDIAILKTMGASARSVTAIFMMQGLIIGVVGTTVGAIGRLRRCRTSLDRYQLIRVPMDVYQVSHVPFTVLPLDFARGRRRRDADLLRRDDLSVAPGRAARSGAGAAIRVNAHEVTKLETFTTNVLRAFVFSCCV